MFNDLIVVAFADVEAASKAKLALEQLRTSPFLGTLNALVVTRDASGRVVVHEQWEVPAHERNASKQVPRLLVEAFFGQPPEAGEQKLVSAGMDETFVQNVMSALGPGSSMMVSYICQGSLVDVYQVLDTLSQLRGTILHTAIPAEVEEAILQ